MDTQYNVVRMFFEDNVPNKVILEEVSLEEAQEHCGDPETSSSTCKEPDNLLRTLAYGKWFDGYEEA